MPLYLIVKPQPWCLLQRRLIVAWDALTQGQSNHFQNQFWLENFRLHLHVYLLLMSQYQVLDVDFHNLFDSEKNLSFHNQPFFLKKCSLWIDSSQQGATWIYFFQQMHPHQQTPHYFLFPNSGLSWIWKVQMLVTHAFLYSERIAYLQKRCFD